MKKLFLSFFLFSLLVTPVFAVTSTSTIEVLNNKSEADADGQDFVTVAVSPCLSNGKADEEATVTITPDTITNTAAGTVLNGDECGEFEKKFKLTSTKAGTYNVGAYIVFKNGEIFNTQTVQVKFTSDEPTPTPTPTVTPTPAPEPSAVPTKKPTITPEVKEVESLENPKFTKVKVDDQNYEISDFQELTLKPEAKLTFSGTALKDAKLSIFLYPEQKMGKVKVDGDGNWEFTFEEKMDPGDHKVEAKISDTDGNVSKRTSLSFKVEGETAQQKSAAERKYGTNIAFWILLLSFLGVATGTGFYLYKKHWLPKKKKTINKQKTGYENDGELQEEEDKGTVENAETVENGEAEPEKDSESASDGEEDEGPEEDEENIDNDTETEEKKKNSE